MTIPTHGGRAVAAEPNGEAGATTPPPHHQSWRARRRAVAQGPFPEAPSPARLVVVVVALLAALALAVSACGTAPDTNAGQPRELNVFAAASLTDVFTQLGSDFTAADPDVKVTFNFAGSNDLVTQVQQGAPADVLATADTSSMDKAGPLTGQPSAFAANKLSIAVAPGNPEHITGLADLAREGSQDRAGGAGGARRQVR